MNKLLFAKDEIQANVRRAANKISYDLRSDDIVLLGILKGCHPFLADLSRAVSVPCEIEYMVASSYGMNRMPGVLSIAATSYDRLDGKTVIVVDDILDTGRTLSEVVKRVKKQGAKQIYTCVLIDKRGRREVDIEPTYSCFTLDNGFVYGYGLDLDGFKRNLDNIFIVEDDEPV